eukprot:7030527-Ditylum_brightwellii.AAC.1
MAVNYDFDMQTNHTKVAVCAPLTESQFLDSGELEGIESPTIVNSPLLLKSPVVCRPVEKPRRHLGMYVCDITLSPKYMMLASTMFTNFAGPNPEENMNDVPTDGSVYSDGMEGKDSKDSKSDPKNENTFSVTARFSGFKISLSAPVLGNHLPLAVVCIPSLAATASLLPGTGIVTNQKHRNEAANDLQVALDMHVWANYFKRGVIRSWEPLIEPYNCLILYEKSDTRGQGITFKSESPFHINITGALLETVDDGIDCFSNPENGIFDSNWTEDDNKSGNANLKSQHKGDIKPSEDNGCAEFREQVECLDGQILNVCHSIQCPSRRKGRVAFSLMNCTGQKIRIHMQHHDENEGTSVISYIENMDWIKLNFPATM